MSFTFQLSKVVQEVGVLLAETKRGRYNYTKLLKLLYLTDRKSLADLGHPISGDEPIAMPQGPVLSKVCDLIRDTSYVSAEQKEYWAKFFRTEDTDLILLTDPGSTELSEYEIRILKGVFAEHKHHTLHEMLEIVGDLPEVKKNKRGTSSRTIPLRDILDAVGRQDRFAEINQNKIEDEFLAAILGR
jgi:hypothetical protein